MGLIAAILALVDPAAAHVPVTVTVFPEDDWCTIVGAGLTGDVYLLVGGDYVGPCTISGPVPDQYGERLIVRSFDPVVDRATFRGDGVSDHVLWLRGHEVSLEDLDVVDIAAGVDAVRYDGEGHRVARLRFTGVGGTAVRQVGSGSALEVVDTRFDLVGGTAIRLGCPGCISLEANLHDDLILGAEVGIHGSDGAAGTVRDLVVADGQIAVTWTDPGPATVVEEGLFVGQVEGMRIERGSVVVRNNLVSAPVALVSVGPGAHALFGNTLFSPLGAGLVTEGWAAGGGLDVRANAWTGTGPVVAGARIEGNQDCPTDACGCWVAPEVQDFHPPPESPLRVGGAIMAFGELNADWCGNPRPSTPTAGALQAVSLAGPGPIDLDFKDDCAIPLDPDPATLPCAPSATDSGATDTSSPTREPPSDRASPQGCGCATGGTPTGTFAGLLAFVAVQRRRRF